MPTVTETECSDRDKTQMEEVLWKLTGQSWQESQRLVEPIVSPKQQASVYIGCWNVSGQGGRI